MTEASLLVSYQFEPGNPYHDLKPGEKRAIDQKLMQKLLTKFPMGTADSLMKVKLDDAYPDKAMLANVARTHLPAIQAGFVGEGTLALSDPVDWSARYVAIPPDEHRHYATLPLEFADRSVGAAQAAYATDKGPGARLDLDPKDRSLVSGMREKAWTGARLVVSLSWREGIPDSDLSMDAKLLRLQNRVTELEARLSGKPAADPFSFHNPHNPT